MTNTQKISIGGHTFDVECRQWGADAPDSTPALPVAAWPLSPSDIEQIAVNSGAPDACSREDAMWFLSRADSDTHCYRVAFDTLTAEEKRRVRDGG